MYQTGSASSCVAVLQALATFATSAGWTVDFNNTATGVAWYLAVHKGSTYLNYVVPTGGGQIDLYGATGYSAGATFSTQAQSSTRMSITPGVSYPGGTKTLNAGPYTAYHFFSSSAGAYLHVLVEISAGVFGHIHAGKLNAAGAASPAIYLTVGCWNNYIPQNSGDTGPSTPDVFSNAKPFAGDNTGSSVNNGNIALQLACTVDSNFIWFRPGNGLNSPPNRLPEQGYTGYTGNGIGFTNSAQKSSPNVFNGLAALIPIPLFVERAVGNTYSYAGDAPDVRAVNMANSNAGDEVTIGADTWKLFPIIANNPVINTTGASASSYPYGLAFLKSA